MIVVLSPERFGLPGVPSDRIRCTRCGAACWISKRATLRPGDAALCVVCAMAVVRVNDTIERAPWALEDLAEELDA